MADVELSEKEMAKLCAWIDLCIPHGGKYSDDMTPADSQFYEQRLFIRKREDSLEAHEMAEFVKNGGYTSADYGNTFIAIDNQGKTPGGRGERSDLKFQVRFSRVSRQLVLKLPSAGNVMLIDLKGRRVLQINVSDEEYAKSKGALQRAPIVGLPAGLYIMKFKGINCSAERVVPVM
jgi:hypothetical protein